MGYTVPYLELSHVELKIRISEELVCKYSEAAFRRWSYKKVFWKYEANLQENKDAEMWFQQSYKASLACNFIKKETLTQVLSCEFCEISKNIFLHGTPLVAASGEWQKYAPPPLRSLKATD